MDRALRHGERTSCPVPGFHPPGTSGCQAAEGWPVLGMSFLPLTFRSSVCSLVLRWPTPTAPSPGYAGFAEGRGAPCGFLLFLSA